MGLEERLTDLHKKNEKTEQTGTICVHAFSDLTYISPVVFLYLLKECYTHGMIFLPIITSFIQSCNCFGCLLEITLTPFLYIFCVESIFSELLTLTGCLDGDYVINGNGNQLGDSL